MKTQELINWMMMFDNNELDDLDALNKHDPELYWREVEKKAKSYKYESEHSASHIVEDILGPFKAMQQDYEEIMSLNIRGDE